MNQYVGLDVSLEETKIHVLDEAGGRVWRGKCASHPDELESTIYKHAPGAVRIGLETGPLTTWLDGWRTGACAQAGDSPAARRLVQGSARQEPRRHALEGGLG
jgi:hypothetical protein